MKKITQSELNHLFGKVVKEKKPLIIKKCEFHTELSHNVRLFLNTNGIVDRKDKYIASGYTQLGNMVVGLGKTPRAAKLMLTNNYKKWLVFRAAA